MVGPVGYPESGRFVLAHEGERVVPRLLVQAVEVPQLLGGQLDAAPTVVRRFRAVERSHLKIRLADALGARIAHRLALRSTLGVAGKKSDRRPPPVRAGAPTRGSGGAGGGDSGERPRVTVIAPQA